MGDYVDFIISQVTNLVKKENIPDERFVHRGWINGLADHEGSDLLHEILAVIGVDFQGDGLGKIQGEDAQDGLSVHNVAADAQIDVVGVTVDDVDKGLDVLSQAQLDVYCFHIDFPLI